MIFKIVLPFLCTLLFFIYTMEEQSNPVTKKVMHQQKCKHEWDKVQQTPEFSKCVELIKLQRKPSEPDFQKALKNLYETDIFKKYLAIGKPPFDECWPPLEKMENKT